MGVAVHQHRAHRVKRRRSPIAEGQRLVDHRSLAWLAQLIPGRGDVARQPVSLVFAGPQAFLEADGSPERSQRRGDRFQDLRDGQAEFGEVRPETFEQHRRHRRIMSQEFRATLSSREFVRPHTANEGVMFVHVQRHRDLQHACPAGRVGRCDHVASTTRGERRSEHQSPAFRQLGDDPGESIEPAQPSSTVSRCPLQHEIRNVERAHVNVVARQSMWRADSQLQRSVTRIGREPDGAPKRRLYG